ncbi:MAG: PocR ligand-binding domain-containing protein, partial [Candidatus Aminicenantales bacterium]
MQITSYVPHQKFEALGDRYCKRTGLPLILIDREGQEVYKLNECGLCLRIVKEEKNSVERNCHLSMLRAVEESFRWGEGYITTCPLGLIIFAVPIIYKQKLLGGLISGFAIFPEMEKDIDEEIANKLGKDYDSSLSRLKRGKLNLKIISLKNTRAYLSFLLSLTRRY